MLRVIAATLMVCLISTQALAQSAQSKKVARDLATEGIELHKQGHHAEAVEKLDRAYQLLDAPTIALWKARALVQLGKLVSAYEQYQIVRRTQLDDSSPDAYREAVDQAASEQEALDSRIPRLTIEIEDAEPGSVRVSLDGQPLEAALIGLPTPVDPGERHVVAIRGQQRAEQVVTLSEGEQKKIALRFESAATGSLPAGAAATGTPAGPAATTPGPFPAARAPSSPVATASMAPSSSTADSGASDAGRTQRIVGWTAIGAGVAGVGVGILGHVLGQGKQGDIEDTGLCEGTRCPSALKGDINQLDTMRALSIAGFAVGGVGLAVGGTLLFLSSRSSKEQSAYVQPWIGLGSAGVRGRF